MPNKSDSFIYESDQLYKKINAITYYDYYNRLIDRYQKERKVLINKEGTFDDKQLAIERYTDSVKFISHTQPISSFSLLFSNRRNGYLAYTNEIPENTLDPMDGLDFSTVSSFIEYLSHIKGTIYEGFFYIEKQLSCFAKIYNNDIYVITNGGEVPLLFFTESFTYKESTNKIDGVIGKATLSSPYFNDIIVDVYTEESILYLEKYYPYSYTSVNDPNPSRKIPGEPIFKTIVINGFNSAIEKIKINGIEIDPLDENPTVLIGKDDRFFNSYIGYKYIGNGRIETFFTFQLKKDPLESTDFKISYYISGEWTEDKTCTIYFSDNRFYSLTTTITIDPQDMYLNVPTIYTLRAEPKYFLQNWKEQENTDLYYLDNKIVAPLKYLREENNKHVFETDSVIVPSSEEKNPEEYMFVITDNYLNSESFGPPVWLYGYTTNEIIIPPDDYISVTPKFIDDFIYKEYENKEYKIEFTWTGQNKLIGVELVSITDDYNCFKTKDFSLEKISLENGILTYKLILNKKIIPETTEGNTEIHLRILFKYIIQRSDLTQGYWLSKTIYKTITLMYSKNRWEITNAYIDNKLLGDSVVYYKIKDNLLNLFTNKYSEDSRLSLSGTMLFSSNIEKSSEDMDWDIRTKTWESSIKILNYGNITLQYKGANSLSNIVTLEHDLPTHPLKIIPNVNDVYTYIRCRIVVELKYTDKIKSIYMNGILIGKQTPFELGNTKDGYMYLTPIYDSTKTEIIAIGVDFIPIKQQDIIITLNFDRINDYDYSNWPINTQFNVPVKSQSEKINFIFILGNDFTFGKNSTGKLKLNDILLADAKIVATVKNVATNVIVAKPNFNPVGDGDFDTINLYIDEEYSSQKEYYLDFEIYEYENARKDDTLPFQLYYLARILFKVP